MKFSTNLRENLPMPKISTNLVEYLKFLGDKGFCDLYTLIN